MDFSRVVEESENPAATPEQEDEPVSIVQAVTEYFADARTRELSVAPFITRHLLPKAVPRLVQERGIQIAAQDGPLGRPICPFVVDGWRHGEEEKQEWVTLLLVLYPRWLDDRQSNQQSWRISVTQAPTDYFNRE